VHKFYENAKTEKLGPDSDVCRSILDLIEKFDKDMELFFDIVQDDNYYPKFKY
jgi:hypothetical protein